MTNFSTGDIVATSSKGESIGEYGVFLVLPSGCIISTELLAGNEENLPKIVRADSFLFLVTTRKELIGHVDLGECRNLLALYEKLPAYSIQFIEEHDPFSVCGGWEEELKRARDWWRKVTKSEEGEQENAILAGDIISGSFSEEEEAEYLVLPGNCILALALLDSEGVLSLPGVLSVVLSAKDSVDVIGHVDITGDTGAAEELLHSLWECLPMFLFSYNGAWPEKREAEVWRKKAREWWQSVSA